MAIDISGLPRPPSLAFLKKTAPTRERAMEAAKALALMIYSSTQGGAAKAAFETNASLTTMAQDAALRPSQRLLCR